MAISSVSGSGFSILTLQSRLQKFQADQLARDQVATRNRFSQKVDAQRRVKARRVVLGPLTASGAEILSGLNRGEVIALSGLDRLRDGAQIDPATAPR